MTVSNKKGQACMHACSLLYKLATGSLEMNHLHYSSCLCLNSPSPEVQNAHGMLQHLKMNKHIYKPPVAVFNSACTE